MNPWSLSHAIESEMNPWSLANAIVRNEAMISGICYTCRVRNEAMIFDTCYIQSDTATNNQK